MTKKGLVLKHTKKDDPGEVRYQGAVSLGGGCNIVGPQKDKKSVAKRKVEKVCRNLGIDLEWIGDK